MAYFEVKVFNQTAKVYLNWSLTASYKTNKLTKRRKNLVDQGSSTSSIFSCFRGIYILRVQYFLQSTVKFNCREEKRTKRCNQKLVEDTL